MIRNREPLLTRRSLLAGGAGTIAILSVLALRPRTPQSPLAKRLINCYETNPSLLALGAYYLSLFPEEEQEALIMEKIRSSMKAYPEWKDSKLWDREVPPGFSEKAFREFIDWEYDAERIVVLEGWFLAGSTARIAALKFLSASHWERVRALWNNRWMEPRSLNPLE